MKFSLIVKIDGHDTATYNVNLWRDAADVARIFGFDLAQMPTATKRLRDGRSRIATIHWQLDGKNITVHNNVKRGKPNTTTLATTVCSEYHYAGSKQVILQN